MDKYCDKQYSRIMKGYNCSEMRAILDSDDEFPDTYKDTPILPAYANRTRFIPITFPWIENLDSAEQATASCGSPVSSDRSSSPGLDNTSDSSDSEDIVSEQSKKTEIPEDYDDDIHKFLDWQSTMGADIQNQKEDTASPQSKETETHQMYDDFRYQYLLFLWNKGAHIQDQKQDTVSVQTNKNEIQQANDDDLLQNYQRKLTTGNELFSVNDTQVQNAKRSDLFLVNDTEDQKAQRNDILLVNDTQDQKDQLTTCHLTKADIYIVKSIENMLTGATLIWFIEFLVSKSISQFNSLKSVLVSE